MTPTQLESVRAARLQLIDLGDESTAKLLDWALPTEPADLTDEQWYDLAQRHANRDWNADGYLDSIKAVCRDFQIARSTKEF